MVIKQNKAYFIAKKWHYLKQDSAMYIFIKSLNIPANNFSAGLLWKISEN